MNNIIQFPTRPKLSFKVKSVTVDLFTDRNGHTERKRNATIILKNLDNGREVIHPVNDFILHYWRYREYNTMAANAHRVVSFLNLAFFGETNNINHLSQLTKQHLTDFLNSLSIKGNKKSTVQHYRKTLVLLYQYLYNNNILQNFQEEEILNLDNNLNGIIYNTNTISNQIHEFKTELILPFIEFAFYEKNEIALGVYYQIFGGLRAGEVVNIKKSNIKNIGAYGEFGQVIKLKNANFREDLNTTSGKGEVKKDRTQVIFPYKTLLKTLYQSHIEKYNSISTPEALFVDKNGNPMSGDNYIYHFNKLKDKFINHLLNNDDIRLQTYGQYLNSMKWSTHIGRGIFSNMMAEFTENVLQIAVARGDSNLNSSLSYIANTERIMNKIQEELENLYSGDLI